MQRTGAPFAEIRAAQRVRRRNEGGERRSEARDAARCAEPGAKNGERGQEHQPKQNPHEVGIPVGRRLAMTIVACSRHDQHPALFFVGVERAAGAATAAFAAAGTAAGAFTA